MIKFKSVRFKYGERGATKSTCLYLSPQVKERIDELSGLSRSAWVERWLLFAVAVQEGDDRGINSWCEWAGRELDDCSMFELTETLRLAAATLYSYRCKD